MKKGMFLLVLIFIVMLLNSQNIDLPPVPTYEFSTLPIDLGNNYYPYMPGSYTGFPLQIQPDNTYNGLEAAGKFIIYQTRETETASRKVKYFYFNQNGEMVSNGYVSDNENGAFYPYYDIEERTADPLAIIHSRYDDRGVFFTFDRFNLNQDADAWLDTPYGVITENSFSDSSFYDDSAIYLWSEIYSGDSPYPGKKRIYIISEYQILSNLTTNKILAYCDVSLEDLESGNPDRWGWHYRVIEQLTTWFEQHYRVSAQVTVHDNYFIISGEKTYSETQDGTLFVLINDNYGEGIFKSYEYDYTQNWPIEDVQNQDGSWLYGGTQPAQLKWGFFASNHSNMMVRNGNTVVFPGALIIEYYNTEYQTWFYNAQLGNVDMVNVTFNIQTHQFGVGNVYPPDLSDGNNNTPVAPWDLNRDGETDAWDENGKPLTIKNLPVYSPDLDDEFHNSLIRICKSDDERFEAMVWMDCYESFMQTQGIDGYEDWANQNKMMIAIKKDNSWYSPIIITPNPTSDYFNEAIMDMQPAYLYPSDKVITLDDDLGRLDLFFVDKNTGGDYYKMKFATIDFNATDVNPDVVSTTQNLQISNYPNPFNPTTTIQFVTSLQSPANIAIYNLKGEKIKEYHLTKIDKGINKVVWNGKDQNDKTVSSGVYLYKIKQGNITETGKMILLK
jgi:hypothetical protein